MKKFSVLDQGFICAECGREVQPLGYSARDHCCHCLTGAHVDVLPGDRKNSCRGRLVPAGAEVSAKKGYVIIYKCAKCGATVRNKHAEDDNKELIIALTAKH